MSADEVYTIISFYAIGHKPQMKGQNAEKTAFDLGNAYKENVEMQRDCGLVFSGNTFKFQTRRELHACTYAGDTEIAIKADPGEKLHELPSDLFLAHIPQRLADIVETQAQEGFFRLPFETGFFFQKAGKGHDVRGF